MLYLCIIEIGMTHRAWCWWHLQYMLVGKMFFEWLFKANVAVIFFFLLTYLGRKRAVNGIIHLIILNHQKLVVVKSAKSNVG